MADHTPRLCDRCGGPLTATRTCTHCDLGRRAGRDPLTEMREALLPWIRGQIACW